MKALCVMFRMILLVSAGIATSRSTASAQTTPPKNARPAPSQYRKLTGDDARRAADLDKAFASALKADHWDEAIARVEELLVLRSRVQGPKHFETVDAEWRLKTLRRVAPLRQEDRVAYQSAITMNQQGEALFFRGQYPQALALFGKSLEIRRRLLTDDHPESTESSNNLATTLNAQGKFAQAEPLFENALSGRRHTLNDDHPDTAQSYCNLANNFKAQGKSMGSDSVNGFEHDEEVERKLVEDHQPSVRLCSLNPGVRSDSREARGG